MKLICLFPVFCFVTFLNYAELAAPFKFRDCSKVKGIVSIPRFELSPHPISFSKNITANADINLHEDVPPNTLLRINIYKVTDMFGFKVEIPVPCFSGLGSCLTELCKFLKSYEEQACPFFPEGVKCGCPLKAGSLGGENITIPMPVIDRSFKIMASGDFRIEVQLITKDKNKEHTIACYSFTGTTIP